MINRKVYEKVRKMDHKQMSDFIAEIYHRGKKDAALNAESLRQELLQLKGLGPAKVDVVVETVLYLQEGKH